MRYEFEWQYTDETEAQPKSAPYIHFVFMLRFPDVPPGKGHAVHFCLNVLRQSETSETGVKVARRGFVSCIPLSESAVKKFTEDVVNEALCTFEREEAISYLNKIFIHEDADFSQEFVDDLLTDDELLVLIETAFDGVTRDDGMTFHEALVISDYGSQEEFIAAGELDTETRWQDVPDSDLSTDTSIYCFLDPKGFRYYLPASMSWAVRNYANDEDNIGFFTYMAVLPTIAPRDAGRGMGEAFDLDTFIKEHSFTLAQVEAIYRFICFMAIHADVGMDEDYYAATQKWRFAARNG